MTLEIQKWGGKEKESLINDGRVLSVHIYQLQEILLYTSLKFKHKLFTWERWIGSKCLLLKNIFLLNSFWDSFPVLWHLSFLLEDYFYSIKLFCLYLFSSCWLISFRRWWCNVRSARSTFINKPRREFKGKEESYDKWDYAIIPQLEPP